MTRKLYLHFPQFDQPAYEISCEQENIIGRGGTLSLPDYLQHSVQAFGKVSRHHFEIACPAGQFTIVDLSRHGTWIASHRLPANFPIRLCDGDEIKIKLTDDDELIMKVSLQAEGVEETEPIPLDSPSLPLQHIIEQVKQFRDVNILGLPGAGKTTLLKKVLAQAQNQNNCHPDWPDYRFWLFCYVNCLDMAELSLSSFFRLLIASTQAGFATWPPEIKHRYDFLATAHRSVTEIRMTVLDIIQIIYQQLGKRTIFLLDQFDDVCYELPPETFVILKEVKLPTATDLADPKVIYMLAMRDEFDMENKHIHQFSRIGLSDYWLPLYDEINLAEIISGYDLPPAKARMSIEWGGGQPRLTELVAQVLGGINDVTLNEKQLLPKLLEDNYLGNHCQEMWSSLQDEEKAALISVASQSARMPLSLQDKLVKKKSLLIDQGNELKFTSALFEAYVESRLLTVNLPEEDSSSPGLFIEEGTSEISVDGQPIMPGDLTRLEDGLLRYLYQNAGKVCSVIEISENVWDYDDPEYGVSKDSIARVVSSLRRKLNQKSPGAGERYIQTVRGRGYRYATK